MDLILLGIGDDGHTASLFSNTDALLEKERLVVANWAPHIQAHRLTFTLPLINASRAIAFLVTDESKAEVLRQALKPVPNEPSPSASLVRPASDDVQWFVTTPAASRLYGVVSSRQALRRSARVDVYNSSCCHPALPSSMVCFLDSCEGEPGGPPNMYRSGESLYS